MRIPALYFDGKTSRQHAVDLSVEAGIASISGDADRVCPVIELKVSERGRNVARKVTFPDGAYLEILDNNAFNSLLLASGHQDSLVVRIQQSWRGTVIACVATVAVLIAAYLYGLPAAAKTIAFALPEKVERAVGGGTLDFLDKHVLFSSQLPIVQQNAIVGRFKAMAPARGGVPAYEILFRKSKIGPNAFALPSGKIVLTDEIVSLLDDDDAVSAVLAHELGHLHERHLMQRIIQSSAIAAAATALFGDVSGLVAGIPTLMLDLKYSRDAEREADDYAVAMLKANGIALSKLTLVFDKLGENSSDSAPYLSSHPPAGERNARIRHAQ